jgi:membrane protein YfhO
LTAAPPVAAGSRPRVAAGDAWSIALAAAASLLPHLSALWPRYSYYFRDFTVTFYPLRLLQARELAAGRWPGWNPYVQEGSFMLPALYPADLLHVLWPGPAAVSWLLTLHFPLAAAAGHWLARELGASRKGACLAGSLYALGGLAVSSLNLYVFLQALALAPLVIAGVRRAAVRGGRSIPVAAAVLALSLTTLAIEFVLQAVLLGLLLGWAALPGKTGAVRMLAAVALGVGLAGLPVALVLGIVGQTVRGVGFAREVALGNDIHPVALLQIVLPGLFGPLHAPVESWWGGAFFTKGFPYFLSLYLGPLAVSLAAAGAGGVSRRTRWVLLAAAAVGLWYALGTRGGLAPLVSSWPMVRWFRFPVKAVLSPYIVVCVLAGLGLDRLSGGAAWGRFAAAAAAHLVLCAAVAAVVLEGPALRWANVDPALAPSAAVAIATECFRACALAVLGLAGATLAWRNRARPAQLALVLGVVAVADVARAGLGMNPQVPPAFFELVPEMKALRLEALGGGRVFSYGPDESPAFRRFLAAPTPARGLWSFFVIRQMLAPYANVLDRVESPDAKDLTSFVARPPELTPEEYRPEAVGSVLGPLRNAAVSRILSLDPLGHADLPLLAAIPAGPPDLVLHVYELARPWPRAYVGCRIVAAAGREDALRLSLLSGFDPFRDVALEQPGDVTCGTGTVTRGRTVPGEERYEVQADGTGYLVTRDTHARGWTATVDGRPADVLRANGKHRAVAVPAGRHAVEMRYHAPGLALGLALMAAAAAACVAGWMRPVLCEPRG